MPALKPYSNNGEGDRCSGRSNAPSHAGSFASANNAPFLALQDSWVAAL